MICCFLRNVQIDFEKTQKRSIKKNHKSHIINIKVQNNEFICLKSFKKEDF